MARRAVKVGPSYLAGAASAALVLCLTFGTLAAVALRADGAGALGPSDWAAIRFTLTQAVVSALLSVFLGALAARALARRRFWGRDVLITLLGAPFILPVIVAILGLLAVYGRAGLISSALAPLGLGPIDIYGFRGVILAHVFFNLPLATRLILQGWLAIPAERFRLAASLGFTGADIARHLEWPMLRATVPGAFVVIFVICTTSFAVALTLGGGPRATTVELSIYQAFRFEFDLGKAALLSLIQFTICAAAAVAAIRVRIPAQFGAGLDRVTRRWDLSGPVARGADALILGAVALFVALPLIMVVFEGAPRLLHLPVQVYSSALNSLLVALLSTAVALGLTLPMAFAIHGLRRGGAVLEGIGYLSIAASPLVMGTGLFLILFPFTSPQALALPVTALINAVMALPFALRVLVPAVAQVEGDFGRLADSLRLTGIRRLMWLHLPRLRRPLGFAAGLTAALSMGDLGVIALFSDPDRGTLPLMIYRLMGAYRMEDAKGAALLLLGLSFLVFWLFDRGGRGRDAA